MTRLGFVVLATTMVSRIISGAVGLTFVIGTLVLVLNLLRMEPDASVLLAAYMAIGGILLGAYLLFYAISGEWRPNLSGRKRGN